MRVRLPAASILLTLFIFSWGLGPLLSLPVSLRELNYIPHFPEKYSPKNLVAGEVVFLEGRETPWLLRDRGFCGYWEMAGKLQSQGFRVSRSQGDILASLNRQEPIGSVLIIPPGKYQKIGGWEIDALSRWIHSGGSVLVMGEHEDAYRVSSQFHNHLLAPFGMIINSDCLFDSEGSSWISIDTNPSAGDTVVFYAAPSISILKTNLKSTVFASAETVSQNGDKKIICCGIEYGMGRVVALGDSENIFNGGPGFGLKEHKNADFFIRLIKWCLKVQDSGSYDETNLSRPRKNAGSEFPFSEGTEKLVWFYSGSNCIDLRSPEGPGIFASMLRENGFGLWLAETPPPPDRWAATLVLGPMELIPEELAQRILSRKTIILRDPATVLDAYTNNGIFLHQLGFRELGENPMKNFERLTGVEFQPFSCFDPVNNLAGLPSFARVRVSPELSAFRVPSEDASGRNMVLRAGRLDIKEPAGKWKPLISLLPSGFVSSAALGLDERVPFRADINRQYYDKKDVNPMNLAPGEYQEGLSIDTRPLGGGNPEAPHLIAIYNEDTILGADTELLTNTGRWNRLSRLFARFAVKWISGN